MRIGMIAPVIESVPPKKYGGTERVISALTEALIQKGHAVTLFASGNSQTSAKLVSVFGQTLRKVYPKKSDTLKKVQATLLHVGNAYALQDTFDIIHDHTSYFGLSFAQASKTPVVSTVHGCIEKESIPFYEQFSNPYLVSISNSQRRLTPQLRYAANVYNGLPMNDYPFTRLPSKYLVAVGRLTPKKGIHNAITIAQKLHLPLIIAAKLDQENLPYFHTRIQPHLGKNIRWVGEVTEKQRNTLMSHALCFLHPLEWEEPFGLTIIEALACGTPVVAFNKGSMPELIQEGKTGFLAKDIDDAVECVKKIDTINRAYCRSYSLSRFNSIRMANEYETIYQTILAQKTIYNPSFFQKSLPLEA